MTSPFGSTRTHVAADHAIIAPDGHVNSPLAGWLNTQGVVLISPTMFGGPRFVQYLAYGAEGSVTRGAAPGVERLAYVLSGYATLDGQRLAADAFAWLPPDSEYELKLAPESQLLVFEKPYEPLEGCPTPAAIIGSLADAPHEPFLGDPDAVLATLLPIEPAFDMAVNVFTYQPGATLPFVETHVMEHGLYMKQGQGVYRLNQTWATVQQGDSIWMGSYCPQWFVAMGKQPAAYIYYKDIHRDPLLTDFTPRES